jgi:hypothetical protein
MLYEKRISSQAGLAQTALSLATACYPGQWPDHGISGRRDDRARPSENEIDADLLELVLWVAEIAESLNAEDVKKVEWFARQQARQFETNRYLV